MQQPRPLSAVPRVLTEKDRAAYSSPSSSPAIAASSVAASPRQTVQRKEPSFWQKLFSCGSSSDYNEPARPQAAPRSAPTEKIPLKTQAQTQLRKAKHWFINSRTPKDQLPYSNWDEYNQAYADRLIDLNDPPEPPHSATEKELTPPTLDIVLPSDSDKKPLPYEAKCYLPPHPSNERERSLAVKSVCST